MKIGIVGAGHIGGTLATLFTRAGHEVALANSRDPGRWPTRSPRSARTRTPPPSRTPPRSASWSRSRSVQGVLALPPEPFAGKIVVTRTTTTRSGTARSRVD
jgi:2-polyprenyl-6-methoxyphenol hydroxylase-like FAD-dependent oxidoreductase